MERKLLNGGAEDAPDEQPQEHEPSDEELCAKFLDDLRALPIYKEDSDEEIIRRIQRNTETSAVSMFAARQRLRIIRNQGRQEDEQDNLVEQLKTLRNLFGGESSWLEETSQENQPAQEENP